VDDLLDYSGDDHETGKNLGDDLAEGKPTLPLIFAMRAGTPDQANTVQHAIKSGGKDGFEPVLGIIQQTGALDYAKQCAQKEAGMATSTIASFHDSIYKQCLLELAEFAVSRNY